MNSVLHDATRLAALHETGLLDSPAEESFNRLTRLVGSLLGAPVALVSLVDRDRQFFKSALGLPEPWASERETPLTHSFCQHVVISGEPLMVEDARTHPVVASNLAIPDLGVAAYLGVPLALPSGQVLGSLCAIDSKPRRWSENDIQTMRDVAGIVMTEIGLRTEIRRRGSAEAQQQVLIAELHHRVKNTLAVVQALISLSLRHAKSLDSFRDSIVSRIGSLANTHTLLIDRQWISASLIDMLDAELRPFTETGRVSLTGADIALPSQIAVAIGMAVHELVTNALKYGALSRETAGGVHLSWSAAPVATGILLTMDWVESGGPAVTKPAHGGFGTQLLERILGVQLGGKITTDFQPDGLRVRIEALIQPEPVVTAI